MTWRPLPAAVMGMTALFAVKAGLLANELGLSAAPAAHASVPAPPPVHAPTTCAPAVPPVSNSERVALQELRSRRVQLDSREQQLVTRETVLAAAEKRVSARVAEMTSLQTRLEALEALRKQRDQANWDGLVKTYEAMPPRRAAAILNDMDPAVLLPVLDRMNDRKAAPILAAMSPDRARAITAQLAEMRLHANQPSN